MGWFMYLYPNIYLQNFKALMKSSIQYLLEEEPIFALVYKTIFNGISSSDSSTLTKTSYLFIKKATQKPVAIYLEVYEEQVYEVISIVCQIIASLQFKKSIIYTSTYPPLMILIRKNINRIKSNNQSLPIKISSPILANLKLKD